MILIYQKKNPLFSFCFVSSFFLWKRGTWGKVLWNFESIVIFSKPRKRYRTGWRNFHETLSSFVRKQRSQMNEIDDRRIFHEQIKSHVSCDNSALLSNVQSLAEKNEDILTSEEQSVFIADDIDFSNGAQEKKRRFQEVDRRKQQRKWQSGKGKNSYRLSEIHHLANPLCFQGFVYVSNSFPLLPITDELNFQSSGFQSTHKVAGADEWKRRRKAHTRTSKTNSLKAHKRGRKKT